MTDAKDEASDMHEHDDPNSKLRNAITEYRSILNSDDPTTKVSQIEKLIENLWENECKKPPSDPLDHFFYTTFCAQMNNEDVSGYATKHMQWTELMKGLLKQGKDEEEEFRNELSVVVGYRMYRNLNEWYEKVLVTPGEDIKEKWEHRHPLEFEVNNEEGVYNDFKKISKYLEKKDTRSERWRKIDFHDQGFKNVERIFRKSFSEFITLMKNEEGVYNLRTSSDSAPNFVWHGESLDRFLSNELSYLCTDLLHHLESNFKTSENYILEWEKFRTKGGKEPNDKFKEYQKKTNMLVSFLKNIFELHKDSKGNFTESNKFRIPLFNGKTLEQEGERFEVFLEVAYLHAVIACQLNDIEDLDKMFKKWPGPSDTDTTARKNRAKLRTIRTTTDGILNKLCNKEKEPDYEAILKGKTEGMSYALLYRWLIHKTPGFYLALASNECRGMLVGEPKLKRKEGSSLWGNKIILRDEDSNYHQIAQSIPTEYRVSIKKKLTAANKYFLAYKQQNQIGEIKQKDLMFEACQFTFSNIEGKQLQSEWMEAFCLDKKNRNETKSKRLIEAIWKYTTKNRNESPNKTNHKTMKKLPIKHIDKEKYNQMLGWWNFKSDDGNSPKFKARILDWVHGDEWGGNFNILDKDDLYAIDLEDVLHYQDGQVGNGIVGGLHAWRFIGPDPPKQYNFEENTSIPEETFNAIPEETFNAYCGMGRLLAALVQKSVAIYRGTESNFKNQDRRGYINDSIHIMWDVITHETKDNSDHETTPFQVWVAFVDWLAYWKNKHDDYFIENDFVVAFNKIKKLAEGNN